MNHQRGILLSLGLVGLLAVSGCTELNDSSRGPYGDPYYGGYGYDDDYYRRREAERYRRERRDLERERDRLEDERERLEEERERQNYNPPPPPPPVAERCPSGFSPSERKCTPAERKRGCKDMRLPGGLGCVRR